MQTINNYQFILSNNIKKRQNFPIIYFYFFSGGGVIIVTHLLGGKDLRSCDQRVEGG